jgi:hypothetical protein
MRLLLLVLLLLGTLLSSAAYSADNSAAERKITALLTTPKSWTMYLEFTDAPTPSDRAQKFVWRYFEKDGKLVGQRIPPLAVGDCLSEIAVRADGFSFRWCDPQLRTADPSLVYDPADAKYPFKNSEPRKLWLQAND